MKFKLDENLPIEAAALLRDAGIDASTVTEQHLSGAADPMLFAVCQREQRTLVTLDTDFADIRSYPPESHAGVVVLRLARQDIPHLLQALSRLVPLLRAEPTLGHLWIVQEHRVRIRGPAQGA